MRSESVDTKNSRADLADLIGSVPWATQDPHADRDQRNRKQGASVAPNVLPNERVIHEACNPRRTRLSHHGKDVVDIGRGEESRMMLVFRGSKIRIGFIAEVPPRRSPARLRSTKVGASRSIRSL